MPWPFAGGDRGEAHASSGTEQGGQLRGTGAEGCRRRGRLRERGQSTLSPSGKGGEASWSVSESTGTPLLPALGTAGTCHWGNKEPGSHPGRLGVPAHSSSNPYRAQGSSEERDTAVGGRARSQVPAPKISPTACQQSSVISIQKKTNSGLTPGTDKLPGC